MDARHRLLALPWESKRHPCQPGRRLHRYRQIQFLHRAASRKSSAAPRASSAASRKSSASKRSSSAIRVSDLDKNVYLVPRTGIGKRRLPRIAE